MLSNSLVEVMHFELSFFSVLQHINRKKSIAEAYYKKIPDEIVNTVMDMLPQQMIEVIEEFSTRYL